MQPLSFIPRSVLVLQVGFAAALLAIGSGSASAEAAVPPKLNILFLTADDMNYDTPGSIWYAKGR